MCSSIDFILFFDDLLIDLFESINLQKPLDIIAKNMFLAKSPFKKIILNPFWIDCFIILDPFWYHLLSLFGIDFRTEFESLSNPKWFSNSTLRATMLDQQTDFSQHCRPYFSTGAILESPLLIVADVGALLVPFCFLLAPLWYQFITFWQVRWTLLGSIAFHDEYLFHLLELSHLPTE